jgi:hypothetical protein
VRRLRADPQAQHDGLVEFAKGVVGSSGDKTAAKAGKHLSDDPQKRAKQLKAIFAKRRKS